MTQVMAHRGASKVEPENTVAAFRRAAAMGAHAVELDVRRTSDGALVVVHDSRLADGRVVRDTLRAELPPSVPSLDAALDACESMWVNVEIKNDERDPDFDPTDSIADETIAALVARGDDSRWLVSSFRMETIDRCRAIAPSVATAWLTVEVPDDVAGLLSGRGHAALHPWVGIVTSGLVAECHAAGLRVNPWTCDDPARMEELVEYGVDGICTNVPDIALEVVSR